MRKALQAEQGKSDMENRIVQLEGEKKDLERQVRSSSRALLVQEYKYLHLRSVRSKISRRSARQSRSARRSAGSLMRRSMGRRSPSSSARTSSSSSSSRASSRQLLLRPPPRSRLAGTDGHAHTHTCAHARPPAGRQADLQRCRQTSDPKRHARREARLPGRTGGWTNRRAGREDD